MIIYLLVLIFVICESRNGVAEGDIFDANQDYYDIGEVNGVNAADQDYSITSDYFSSLYDELVDVYDHYKQLLNQYVSATNDVENINVHSKGRIRHKKQKKKSHSPRIRRKKRSSGYAADYNGFSSRIVDYYAAMNGNGGTGSATASTSTVTSSNPLYGVPSHTMAAIDSAIDHQYKIIMREKDEILRAKLVKKSYSELIPFWKDYGGYMVEGGFKEAHSLKDVVPFCKWIKKLLPKPIKTTKGELYFETQDEQKCGIHAIANLLNARLYDTAFMNLVAACVRKQMLASARASGISGKFVPHVFNPRFGTYAREVVEKALQLRGYTMEQISQKLLKSDPSGASVFTKMVKNKKFKGFIINEDGHWIAIKPIRAGQITNPPLPMGWYDMDSLHQKPKPFTTAAHVVTKMIGSKVVYVGAVYKN